MVKAGTVRLIAESPAAHGVFEQHTKTERTVFCTVRSVGMRESYEALAHGLSPELVLILQHDFDYHREKTCVYNGVLYKVIRTYATEDDGIELTLERMEGNADV